MVLCGIKGGRMDSSNYINSELLHKGRMKCPVCGKKGVGFADHAHAFGWKDYGRAYCRYCGKTFKILEEKVENKEKEGESK